MGCDGGNTSISESSSSDSDDLYGIGGDGFREPESRPEFRDDPAAGVPTRSSSTSTTDGNAAAGLEPACVISISGWGVSDRSGASSPNAAYPEGFRPMLAGCTGGRQPTVATRRSGDV